MQEIVGRRCRNAYGASGSIAGWHSGGIVVDDTTSVLRSSGVSVCKLLRRPAGAFLLAPPSTVARLFVSASLRPSIGSHSMMGLSASQ